MEMVVPIVGVAASLRRRGRDGVGGEGNRAVDDQDVEGGLGGRRKGAGRQSPRHCGMCEDVVDSA